LPRNITLEKTENAARKEAEDFREADKKQFPVKQKCVRKKSSFLSDLFGFRSASENFGCRLAELKERSASKNFHSVHSRHTTYVHRVLHSIKAKLKLILSATGIFIEEFLPPLLPIAALCIAVLCITAFSTHTVALEVMVDEQSTGIYVKNRESLDEIKSTVASRLAEDYDGEYCVEVYPTVELAFIPKTRLTATETATETLFNISSKELGKSYGLFLGGKLVGTLINREEIDMLLDEIASYYLEGLENCDYEILETISVVKDRYASIYEMSYSEMKDLFTEPKRSEIHYVLRSETAEKIAAAYGISVPVLKMLNPETDMKHLQAGQGLEVGQPEQTISVLVTQTVETTEVIPFQTIETVSKDIYSGFDEIQQQGSNGAYEVSYTVKYVNGVEISRTENSRIKTADAISQIVIKGTKRVAATGRLIWPVERKGNVYVSSPFGYREIFGQMKFHTATDIAAPYGNCIYAADGGTVIDMGWDNGGLGNFVKIDHGNGYVTTYGHCSSIAKSLYIGMTVYQGYTIAYIGETGTATGTHVHFTLFSQRAEEYIDNYPFISTNNSYLGH